MPRNDSDDEYVPPQEEMMRQRIRSVSVQPKKLHKQIIKKTDPIAELLQSFGESKSLSSNLERENNLRTTVNNDDMDSFYVEYDHNFYKHHDYEEITSILKQGDGSKIFAEKKRGLCHLYKMVEKFGGYKKSYS